MHSGKRYLGVLAGILVCLPAAFVSAAADLGPYRRSIEPSAQYFTCLKSAGSGLSYNCIHALIEDSRGFVWIGTSDGLNRYDGKKFRSYRKDELGGMSAFIVSLCEDDAGNIWIGTDSGVVVYDVESDTFRPLSIASDCNTVIVNKVTAIKKDRRGVIWMAVNSQGLFSYDPEENALTNWFVEDGRQVLPANITSFCFDVNNDCWISLYFTDLYRADRRMKELVPVEIDGRRPFRNDNIIEIIESPHNTLYVATVEKGVCEVAVRSNKVNTLISNAGSHFVAECLVPDRRGRLWTGTTEGIYRWDSVTETVKWFTSDSRDRFSLSDRHVLSILIDSSDGIWVGTDTGGVNYSGPYHRNFHRCYLAGGEPVDGCQVRGFADDGEGRLWIATEKRGLMCWSFKNGELSGYRNRALPEMLSAINYSGGRLWLGSMSGLYCLDPRSGSVRLYCRRNANFGSNDDRISSIRTTSGGDLLVGTTLGMLRYDRLQDRFVPIAAFNSMFVTDMAEDADGSLWVGTYANGLIRYNPADGIVLRNYLSEADNLRSLPNNKVLSVFRDSAGRIWAGTFGAGFCRWNPVGDDFDVYDHTVLGADKMPSDVNYTIVEDDNGHLWISTGNGLLCFTPDGSDHRLYTTTDGLLNSEFSYNAGFKSSDGYLFFGSSDGFIRFNPRMFYRDTDTPTVVITEMRVNDRPVRTDEEDSPLHRNVDRTAHITLKASQNSFGFGFALTGFQSPAGNRILCCLDGFDSAWRQVSDDNSIYWSNIPAGNYTLRIKSLDSNGEWSESHAPVEITVREYFYKSTVARLVYTLLFLMVVLAVFRWLYIKAVDRERERQQEEKRRHEIEIFNEKIRFFSKIVHEIKTPLTLIRTPLQNIIDSGKCSREAKDDLVLISNNAEYLSSLLGHISDFMEVEHYGYRVEYRSIDIIEKLEFICLNYSETARRDNISLDFVHTDDHIFICADESGLNKIFNNLLHNAVKYARSRISVTAVCDGGQVRVSFRNDGPLIPPADRVRIFKPFEQAGNAAGGLGIGLSLARTMAELHNGSLVLDETSAETDFVLTLPVKHQVADSQEKMPPPSPDGKSEDGPAETATLFVVEDNADLSDYIRRRLEPEFQVITIPTAERALELLPQYDVSLVVTDITLHGMSGLELCRRICSDFETSHIPVIILSAVNGVENKVVGMKAGASLYIEKPFNLEYLRACIRNILDKRGIVRKAFMNKSMNASGEYSLPTSDKEFLAQLDPVIMANISDPDFTNERLAEAMHLSKSTLNRKVKGLLDTTPNDYIRTKKLLTAARMLSENRCRISEVAYSVGFNTPSYFAKCFRKHFGMLPVEYMKLHNGDNGGEFT